MTEAGPIDDLIAELDWRGFIKDCTDLDALREHLRTPGRKIYCGFDPTSESLTIGNLVPIMMLAHVRRAGTRARNRGARSQLWSYSNNFVRSYPSSGTILGRFVECS